MESQNTKEEIKLEHSALLSELERFLFEVGCTFKAEYSQIPKLLDPDTILNRARALVESNSAKLTGFEKYSDFDFPQETKFQAFHPPSSKEEGLILDWKQFVSITILENQVFDSDSQTIMHKVFTNPFAPIEIKEEYSQLERLGSFKSSILESSIYVPLTRKTKIPIIPQN